MHAAATVRASERLGGPDGVGLRGSFRSGAGSEAAAFGFAVGTAFNLYACRAGFQLRGCWGWFRGRVQDLLPGVLREALPVISQNAATPPYLDTNLTPEQRATDLVHRMTPAEMAIQMHNNSAAVPRLNIPAYQWWREAFHGVINEGVTQYPVLISLAATFDAPGVHTLAAQIGIEGRIKHVQNTREGHTGIMGGRDFWFRLFRIKILGNSSEKRENLDFSLEIVNPKYLMEVDGVSCEPLSDPDSLLSGKNTGKTEELAPKKGVQAVVIYLACSSSEAIRRPYAKNKQGILIGLSGNCISLIPDSLNLLASFESTHGDSRQSSAHFWRNSHQTLGRIGASEFFAEGDRLLKLARERCYREQGEELSNRTAQTITQSRPIWT